MKTIYSQLADGDVFTAPDETTYFVRAKTQGIIYCQDVDNPNTDPVSGSNLDIVTFTPGSAEFAPEIARLLDLDSKVLTVCAACTAAGVVVGEPATYDDACDPCTANFQLINWFKNALG